MQWPEFKIHPHEFSCLCEAKTTLGYIATEQSNQASSYSLALLQHRDNATKLPSPEKKKTKKKLKRSKKTLVVLSAE